MKINDYVRTKDGVIAKITDIIEDYSIDCDRDVFDLDELAMMEIPWDFKDEYIVNSSPNIIDLIKKKDIVVDYKNNLYRVVKVWNGYVFTDKKNKYGQVITLVDYQIKQILTHEEFETSSYKVGE